MKPTREARRLAAEARPVQAALFQLDGVKEQMDLLGAASTLSASVSIPDDVKALKGAAGAVASTAGATVSAEPTTLSASAREKLLIGKSASRLATIGLPSDLSRGPTSLAQLALADVSAARRSPAYGGTFGMRPGALATYQQALLATAALPPETSETVRRGIASWDHTQSERRGGGRSTIHERRDPAVWPAPRRRAPAKPTRAAEPAPARALPEELGPALAERLARKHRQEAKALLVSLGLEEGLEELEAIEKRLLEDTRPGRRHAALSASLLLEALANRLFPPRTEPWVCDRFETEHDVGAARVRNRLTAFAASALRELAPVEHKLFIAEFDLVGRWAGEGHHVVFTFAENVEGFCALLRVLAILGRAHRLG